MRTWFDIKNDLHCLFPKGNQGIETRQIEVILDEVFRHFAEVFMSGEGAEPRNPSRRRGRGRGGYRSDFY